jgi:pimeloyl-ACP methyl ester carboxylesterase
VLVDVHGARLYVEDFGGDGPPLLFLHGFLFDGRQYQEQITALRDRYRCVTLDFRGQGRSGPARDGFQIERQAADVSAVIRRLGLAPVHLVGLSMGGFVGLRLAARQPDLVRSLALLNTSASRHAPAKVPELVSLAAIARLAGLSPRPLVDAIERELYGPAFRTDPGTEAVRAAWRERWAAADRSSLVRTMLGFLLRSDVRAELPDIGAPTLVVAGAADASLPAERSREIAQLVAGARYVELPGVGHSAPLEAPDEVTRLLTEFLASVPDG